MAAAACGTLLLVVTSLTLIWRAEAVADATSAREIALGAILLSFLVLGVGVLCVLAMARIVRKEEDATRAAGHDLLTGAPNRLLFHALLDTEIAKCRRYGGRFALMYLDLDRFKEINDTFGHDGGDRLLIALSQRIATVLRAGDQFARFGGDEFAVLQTAIKTPRDCELLARRILSSVQQPFDLDGSKVNAGISIGIAFFPQDGIEFDDLTRHADIALYRAKSEGRNRYTFFERRLGEELQVRKAMEDELRAAITNNELALDYLPTFASDGVRIVGVEALVRWRHPSLGMLAPSQFLGLAEERGLIRAIGEWVLRQACLQARDWPHLRLAINISPAQLRDEAFVPGVSQILAETEFDPNRLEFELTEAGVVADADRAEAVIIDLRLLGVRVALDDFGAGFSSLIYLRRFAIDKIKIDRLLIGTLENTGESAMIFHSIVQMAKALGMVVLAEGVETNEQHVLLQAAGCQELQGFLFSRPVSPAKITALVGPIVVEQVTLQEKRWRDAEPAVYVPLSARKASGVSTSAVMASSSMGNSTTPSPAA